jgi:heat shock transcription factor
VQAMGQRLLTTENRQQHMMSFLAKAMQNPSFLAQLMQQSEKKRLATTVRKKRRLPKQDSSEEDSAGSDTPADNQIVAYNANGGADANGARAMIMQFFNSADAASSPSLDSGPLEALFRDLGSAPSGPDVGTMNRQSGVTLTEMNTPGLSDALPGPVVMDASPDHELPIPPHLTARIPRLEGMR